jgi:hypothetical protein
VEKIKNIMITDLNPDLDRTSAGTYINGLVTELDKLYLSLSRDSALSSTAQADIVKQLRDYVRVTQLYPETPPREEPPVEQD